ncbi:MAG TPA: hypothetical protein VH394_14665 [Thermoanaerobaculia bacterium]|jgi:hypothetical protein|nr:hypothetical protein [Thermoanaerobaculia bacterium]
MKDSLRAISALVIMAGLVLGSQAWALSKKGPKISVGDDPSIKNGSPQFVLVEVSDYQ